MNGNYCAESKYVEALVDQIGQNTKNELFPQKMSHTLFITNQSILMKRGKGNIVGGIFINHGQLHDNCQHSEDYKLRRKVVLF